MRFRSEGRSLHIYRRDALAACPPQRYQMGWSTNKEEKNSQVNNISIYYHPPVILVHPFVKVGSSAYTRHDTTSEREICFISEYLCLTLPRTMKATSRSSFKVAKSPVVSWHVGPWVCSDSRLIALFQDLTPLTMSYFVFECFSIQHPSPAVLKGKRTKNNNPPGC